MMLDLLWHSSHPRAVLPTRRRHPAPKMLSQQRATIRQLQQIHRSPPVDRLISLLQRLDPRPRVPRHSLTGKTSGLPEVP
ncbi:hypothetical protein [Phaeobacter inhibens]|uniref:hypothetical protein n=1 Tax=Phaeobacter inhibens TaxID=221822 RepID=UPI000C9BFD3A|nr:hypothetical protein [Phaeobacter inhibens]AUQ57231.1 hypothetical protein PhaeoP30_00283 [Phaeobacter inhibens]AUR06534.1 hypothetical protein PhaeoP59_00327 [Phaeobacter inhibens]AUR10329.1 hypothetical protein PhaeoP48_00311 [Phaeobacter inhibens]